MIQQIDCTELKRLLASGERVLLVDVRQPWEHEIAALPQSLLIPLQEMGARAKEIEEQATATGANLVIAYCHHGVRSLQAARFLERVGYQVASLAGGIDRWSIEVDPGVPRY